MSDKWIREQLPEYKGKLPKLIFGYAKDGAKRISFVYNRKEYAVSFNNDQLNMRLIEQKRLEVLRNAVNKKKNSTSKS